MKEIVFVTRNKGKVALAQSYFDKRIKLINIDTELIEPRTDDIQEIQSVLDRILDRHKEWNISYSSGDEVKIDV
jgi:inosine/xanthosine triphosphate pyrophosphatase family protein